MKKLVCFLDAVCPKPYDGNTLRNGAMGGSEASLVRVAERLTRTHDVVVQQHNRTVEETVQGVRYTKEIADAPYYVVMRHPALAIEVAKNAPRSRVILWLEDIMSSAMGEYAPHLQELNIITVPVSDWHVNQIREMIKTNTAFHGRFYVRRIYNPLDDDLHPRSGLIDKNKLVFFSSPHKGLDYTLKTFQNLRNFNKDFKLYIANPGYLIQGDVSDENVVNLGPVPHSVIMDHVRSSLCMYYPNYVFPETFGCVMAEANAVGTPFITHPLGAAYEVSDHPSQLVDVRDPKKLIDRVMEWYNGARPIVRARPEFRMSTVIRDWLALLK